MFADFSSFESTIAVPLLLNIVVAFVTAFFTERFVRKREKAEAFQREKDDAARRAIEALGHLKSAYYQIESSERYILRHFDDFEDPRFRLAMSSIEAQLDALRAQMIGNMGQWKGDLYPTSPDYNDLENLIKIDRDKREVVVRSQRSLTQSRAATDALRRTENVSSRAERKGILDDLKVQTIEPELFYFTLATIFRDGSPLVEGESLADTIVRFVERFDQARGENEVTPRLMNLASMALYGDGRYQEAAPYSERATKGDPKQLAYLANLGDNLEMFDLDRAAQVYREIVLVFERGDYIGDPSIPLEKSYVFFVQNNDGEAAQNALEALRSVSEAKAENAVLKAKLFRAPTHPSSTQK